MVHNFYRTKLVFEVLLYIYQKKQDILKDLVATPNDSALHLRRLRVLTNLAHYEQQFLNKVSEFETDCIEDYDILDIVQREIQSVADINV